MPSPKMETLRAESWDDYHDKLKEADQMLAGRRRDLGLPEQGLLYRGQADARWGLLTTLERRSSETYSMDKYVLSVDWDANELEAITGKKWELPPYADLRKMLDAANEVGWGPPLPLAAYLVYLRHHGLSSPLLDWTKSPYIAAFFAFHEWQVEAEEAAVFVYCERPDGTKGGVVGQPEISIMGSDSAMHLRHYTQQAVYTVATKRVSHKHVFVSHESAIGRHKRQDMCVKIVLPRSIRRHALQWLQAVNVNHYTLFQTEDSLVRAIDLRVFDLGQ